MAFGEKLKELRTASNMTQQKLAEVAKLSLRTVSNYESGETNPKSIEVVKRIAKAMNATIADLMDEEDFILLDAQERGGANAARDMRLLVKRVSGMFAGGDLGDDDKDAAIRALTEAYWKSKDEAKKYAPKKKRKDSTDGEK